MHDHPDTAATPDRIITEHREFSDSRPLDPEIVHRASEFMSTARRMQRRSGCRLTGRRWLSDETLKACAQAAQGSQVLALLGRGSRPVAPSPAQRLVFETFEEMCRRRCLTVPPEVRPAVYRLLRTELAVNSRVLQAPADQVASATVYNGCLDWLPEAYPEFRSTPGVFRHAVASNPSNPEGFLRGVQQHVSRLERDERFAALRDTPGVFRVAAVSYPSDPEGHLLTLLANGRQEAGDGPQVQRISTASNPATHPSR